MALKNLITCTFLLNLLLLACSTPQKPYDKEKWMNPGVEYKNRKHMIKDVMENHLAIGMSYNKMIEIIGNPEYLAPNSLPDNQIKYTVEDEYGWDIDPVCGINLFIQLAPDSTIEKYWLEKW